MSPYPSIAYRQLFPDKRNGPAEKALPFNPSEDGDHYRPEPNFFEWWYFDVALEDGSYLVVVLYSSLFNAVDHKPTLDLRYYPPGGSPIVVIGRFDRTAYRAETDRCCVKIGDCLAVDKGDRYCLSLRQESLAAELTFWPQLPGWRAGTGHLFADPTSGHHFDWIVPVPRARVEGTLTVAGQRRTVVGTGYHDHNWGNVYLPAAFSGWTWGRVQAADWTLIFGDVIGRGASPVHITPFMLAQNDEILLATDRIRITLENPAREPYTGTTFFHHLNVATEEGPKVELTLAVRRAIETLDFAAPRLPLASQPRLRGAAEAAIYLTQGMPGIRRLTTWLLGKGSYLRWEADYRLDLPDQAGVETGLALYEVILW